MLSEIKFGITRAGVEAAVVGALVGDALGVPYEFNRAELIPAPHLLEMDPPEGFYRSHESAPTGTWSDDGAQLLAMLNQVNKGFDTDSFGADLVAWLQKGKFTPDGNVFDVGMQTRTVLNKLRYGTSAYESGLTQEHSNGNGSLMRTLPAAWAGDCALDVIRVAHAQSKVTHAHPWSYLACSYYSLVAHYLLAHDGNEAKESTFLRMTRARSWARHTLLEVISEQEKEALQTVLTPGRPRGSGFVIDSLESALYCVEATSSYEEAVRKAISLGDDTDTTASITGGLAGILYGLEGIPLRWRNALKGMDLVQRLLDNEDWPEGVYASDEVVLNKSTVKAVEAGRSLLASIKGRLPRF